MQDQDHAPPGSKQEGGTLDILPGLQLRCPPPFCQRGLPGQCRGSAAPEPPARCTSCSQSLDRSNGKGKRERGDVDKAEYVAPFRVGALLTFVGVVVTDLLDGIPHHLLVVHIGPRRDLTTEKHHASLAHRFCNTMSDRKLEPFHPVDVI